MKRTMIYALVGVVMLAFASCGGSKESKQFSEQKQKIQELEELVASAETCDDLTMAAFGFLALAFDDAEYAENEKMTSTEEEEYGKLVEAISDKMEIKATELGCNDEEEIEDDGFEFEDEEEE